MAWWLALLAGGVGPSWMTADSPLPVTLGLYGIDAAAPESPEQDPLWPVAWIENGASDSSGFRWPEPAIHPEADRLPSPAGEKRQWSYPGRIELGLRRIQEMEDEPKFFPAVTRAIFGLPLGLIEAATAAVVPDTVIVNGKEVFNQATATDDMATLMVGTFVQAETRVLAGLRTSEINTFGTQMGTEDPERDRFTRLQWRGIFTAAKNAYRERYQVPALDLDTIASALSTGNWVDFVVVPTAVSLYAARFGIDRRIRLSDDARVDFRIEKVTRFRKVLTSDHGGRLFSASVNLFKLPVSAIVSIEAAPRGVGFEFIGIGSDLGAAISGITSGKPRELRDFR